MAATLMLVDDDAQVAEMFGEALTEAGFVVDVFTTGIEALNSCIDCRYAMVIADVNMPDIDGISLLQMIRAQRPNMPYIIISGGGAPSHEVVADADAFVQKIDGPFNLVRKVRYVLSVKGTEAGSSQLTPALKDEVSGKSDSLPG